MLYSSGIHGAIGEPMDVGKALGSIAEDDFEAREAHLEAAQYAKIDAMIDRLGLKPGDKKRVLEIGCGWGALAIRLCTRFPECSVTGLTLSNEQHAEASKRVADAGLADKIEIVIRDYRDVTDVYDAVISIEMLEAVGHEHLPTYFRAVSEALTPGGVASIQVITMPDARYASYCASESDFIRAYIFPGGHLPSVGAMKGAAEPSGLALQSFDDIGEHYAVTLRLWRERMMARRATVTGELGYSEKFLRMFEFYFAYCEAGFAHGLINDLQMTWVKTGDAVSDAPGAKSPAKSATRSEIAGEIGSSGRRVSALAVCLYAASAARDFAAKGFIETLADATHIFGVAFCVLWIAATHACVTVAAAGAIAVLSLPKTEKDSVLKKTNALRDARRVASPAAAALVRFAVAVAATWSAIETIGVSIESGDRITVSGLTDAFLATSTPVQGHLAATLATIGAASAALASLVEAAFFNTSSVSGVTRVTPGVTRSARDAETQIRSRIVDAFVLLICVSALKHESFLNATAFFAVAHVAEATASLAAAARAASGYPSRDPSLNLRRLTDTASEVCFIIGRVTPHLAAFLLTAPRGAKTIKEVVSALIAAAAAKARAGAPAELAAAAAAAAPAAECAAAAAAAAATAALALDAGAWGRAERAKTAESAVRDRIIRLATSADV